MRLILLPGLGTDERCFTRQIDHFIGTGVFRQITVPQWLRPGTRESLPEYARRMADAIQAETDVSDVPDEPAVVVGMSFGGALAPFVAERINAKACVVMSMVRDPKLFPRRLYPVYVLQRFFPWTTYTLFRLGRFVLWFFLPIAHSVLPRFYFAVLREVLTQDAFNLFWFLRMLMIWGFRRQETPAFPRTTYIYGALDYVMVPRHHVPEDIILPKAGHALNYSFADEVNQIIEDAVRKP